MDGPLRALLDVAVGDPPHDVTIGAVRRRVTRRRRTAAVAGIVVVLALCGAGASVSAVVAGGGAEPAISTKTVSKPAFYWESNAGQDVVRSTATGAVTARPRCPWRGASIQDVAVSDNETFFLDCQEYVKAGPRLHVIWTRIYRFKLSRTGRVTGYSLVPGGSFKGLDAWEIAASPDGSELAVAMLRGAAPYEVYIVNAATGSRALWTEGNGKQAQIRFGVESMSFTGNGTELAFLTSSFCAVDSHGCTPIAEVRALNPLARGGRLTSTKVLFSLSAIAPPATSTASDLVISPDGSVATLVIQRYPSPPSSTLAVIQVSARSGRQVGVLYRRVAAVASQVFFNADPSGRYFLIGYQESRPTEGWLTHGKIVPLAGSGNYGNDVSYEDW
jgi:hypothetical protein